MHNHTPVVIVSDTPHQREALHAALGGRFVLVDAAADPAQLADLITCSAGAVIVYSLSAVADARELHAATLGALPGDAVPPFQALLACRRQDTADACESCLQGSFDNYVVDRPIYDMHRLLLTMHGAVAAVRTQTRMRVTLAALRACRGVLEDERSGLSALAERSSTAAEGMGNECEQLLATIDDSVVELLAMLRSAQDRGNGQELNRPSVANVVTALMETRVKAGAERLRAGLGDSFADLAAGIDSAAARLGSAIDSSQDGNQVAGASVLVVDDEPFFRKMIAHALHAEGYEVRSAECGEEGLALMANLHPACVLMDHSMPGLTGIDTIRRAKRCAELRQIPIVMLTGNSDRNTVREALAAGAADFIVKPGNRETFARKIAAQIDNRR